MIKIIPGFQAKALGTWILQNSFHPNTLYNYAFILHQVAADQKSLLYLERMNEMDDEAKQLLQKIKNVV